MASNTVYIAFKPSQSLHVAQPVFSGLRRYGYDIYMDIDNTPDRVNFNQIAAREHFVVLLTEATLTSEKDELVPFIERALALKRNVVPVHALDVSLNATVNALKPLAELSAVRFLPGEIGSVIDQLHTKALQREAAGDIVPPPPEDMATVKKRTSAVRSFTEQATIRLNTEKLFFRGVIKIRDGDYQGALEDLNKVIEDNPNNENAFLQRGRVLRYIGDTEAAIRDYQQATRLSPKLATAYIGLGETHYKMGHYPQALVAFDRVLELQPENTPAVGGLALTRHAMKQTDEAVRLWQWLIKRDQNYADPAWTAETFGWDSDMQKAATELVTEL